MANTEDLYREARAAAATLTVEEIDGRIFLIRERLRALPPKSNQAFREGAIRIAGYEDEKSERERRL